MFNQPTGYLSAKLEDKLRPDGSRGVFARQPIKAGERLAVWGGEIITWETLTQLPQDSWRLALQIEEGLYIFSSREGPADWVNHSCDPNAGLSGQIVLVAIRDIASGEEACFDYAMSDSSPYDEFVCRCGAANCRQQVTGNDWQKPELQQRYAGYFSPYLQRQIDQVQEMKSRSRGQKPNGADRNRWNFDGT